MPVQGTQLLAPEIGWRRYDDNASEIASTNTMFRQAYSTGGTYKSTLSYTSPVTTDPNIEKDYFHFFFTGRKLVIGVLFHNLNSHSGFNVTIDGVSYGDFRTGNASTPTGSWCMFVKEDFEDGIHYVQLRNVPKSVWGSTNTWAALDFIDIDINGVLINPYEIDKAGIDKSLIYCPHDGESKSFNHFDNSWITSLKNPTAEDYKKYGNVALNIINPEVDIKKKSYVNKSFSNMGSGKVYSQQINLNRYDVKKISFQ